MLYKSETRAQVDWGERDRRAGGGSMCLRMVAATQPAGASFLERRYGLNASSRNFAAEEFGCEMKSFETQRTWVKKGC